MNQQNTLYVLLGVFALAIVIAGVFNYRLWKRYGAGSMRTADAARMQREASEALAKAAAELVVVMKATGPARTVVPFKRPDRAGGQLDWPQRLAIAQEAHAAAMHDFNTGAGARRNPHTKGTHAFVCWALEYTASLEEANQRTGKRGPSHKGIAP